ncbi:Homocitrate synthase, mitochondrial [Fusarium keratoplasticum]|uniref:Homocitrate synthase, mitochondrial n=1 Tax=Fusarium keratoplasticum TaxID=1328300 RepID=A0ACC0QQD7_9HYPO|nr:Homocitrate synthase, mitochondrial [Fusarium keratoplasticum]KAI8663547.1 Homocitrate synthase, mitochondrial [Fusarium keratoplasticum]KAI8664200.1 Homocitrate synthase, mitochondrial [Fusarium keratoplasticum]
MQTANNPISHHTSHTMGQGAASSNGGDNSSGTHCVGHHTSHTMGNGASSSSSGANGGGGVGQASDGEGNGRNGSVLEASLTSPDINNLNTTTIIDDDTDSLADSISDLTDGGASSGATSMRSSVNLANFSIIDTTLREGEQFATAHFDTETKIKIAQALDEFGVEYLELTSPAASEQSKLDCQAICKLGLKAKILCHIRCNMDDARIAVQTGVDGINMCIGTSAQLMKHSHGKDLDWIAKKATEVIQFAQSHGVEVRFSGEDSFRSDFSEIIKLYSLVDRLGAQRVGIADTVGGATWREVDEKISTLRQVISCDIETHFHNDTGCAVSNAFTALEAGATHIDTTVLGIGERNGITSLGGLMASLMYSEHRSVLNKYKLEKLAALEELVAKAVDVEIPWNNFVVPANF